MENLDTFMDRLAGRRGILKTTLLDEAQIVGLDTLNHPVSRLVHLSEERFQVILTTNLPGWQGLMQELNEMILLPKFVA